MKKTLYKILFVLVMILSGIVLFLLGQRYFVRGIVLSGIKG